jgi:hypothetical protein
MLHQDTPVAFPFIAIDIVFDRQISQTGRFRPESAEDYAAARKYSWVDRYLKA